MQYYYKGEFANIIAYLKASKDKVHHARRRKITENVQKKLS